MKAKFKYKDWSMYFGSNPMVEIYNQENTLIGTAILKGFNDEWWFLEKEKGFYEWRKSIYKIRPVLKELSSMSPRTLKKLFSVCYEYVYNHKPTDCKIDIIYHEGEKGLKASEDVLGKIWNYDLTIDKNGIIFSVDDSYLTIPTFELTKILIEENYDIFGLIENDVAASKNKKYEFA